MALGNSISEQKRLSQGPGQATGARHPAWVQVIGGNNCICIKDWRVAHSANLCSILDLFVLYHFFTAISRHEYKSCTLGKRFFIGYRRREKTEGPIDCFHCDIPYSVCHVAPQAGVEIYPHAARENNPEQNIP